MEAPPTSLTDQYLADLDDLEGSDNESVSSQEADVSEFGGGGNGGELGGGLIDDEGEDMEFDEGGAGEDDEQTGQGEISLIVKLAGSQKLKEHMQKVTSLLDVKLSAGEPINKREYDMVVRSNAMITELEGEIVALHKYLRDLYAPKFPELESLVLAPLDYTRVVQRIGNETDLTAVELGDLLPNAQVMVVTVTATTTVGKPLPDDAMNVVKSTCTMILEVDEYRLKLLEFVESRVMAVAPNLSALVGGSVAAKLIVTAGGLDALASMPACNLQVIGKKRKTLAGLSTASTNVHAGFLFSCPIVVAAPPSLKNKAVKLLANKCTLAVRVDQSKDAGAGGMGAKFAEDIRAKIEKLLEPPPIKKAKALPRPDEKPKNKRGGKRVRKMKERYAMTEMRKQSNRMGFNVAEDEAFGGGDETMGLGMLGKQGMSGKIRVQVKDHQKGKVSKQMSKRLGHHANQSSSSGATGGLSSTVAISAATGMVFEEVKSDASGLVTPARVAQLTGADTQKKSKYFSGATKFSAK